MQVLEDSDNQVSAESNKNYCLPIGELLKVLNVSFDILMKKCSWYLRKKISSDIKKRHTNT